MLVAFAVGAFSTGCTMDSFQMMLVIYAAGVVLITLITVPNWPFFNRHPLKWLDPIEAERHPKLQPVTSKKKLTKQHQNMGRKAFLINALRSNQCISVYSFCYRSRSLFELIEGSKWFESQLVDEVLAKRGRGKHTTHHVSLFSLSGGGYLADTPGFNQPSLMKVTKISLAQAFPELHILDVPFLFISSDQKKEPRLDLKKHRSQSRKQINLSKLQELDDLDDVDDEDKLVDVEEGTLLTAMGHENK
ncbi:hypothetical protein NE237_021337 [Protea cynaroides]|uniref:EngC GTPase domain-containing protein n=1 Tax=Protea cynaroides TaxID=273540 RepID=A0A9Q0K3F7_9MAGN|nr:hypothetical protein NE237_021337 [Protea cynaroides]